MLIAFGNISLVHTILDDRDGDGYVRAFDINVTVNQPAKDSYYVQAYEDDVLFDDYVNRSDVFAAKGSETSVRTRVRVVSDVYPSAGMLGHGTAEFLLKLYSVGPDGKIHSPNDPNSPDDDELIQSWSQADDADLGNVLVETSTEDAGDSPPAPAVEALNSNPGASHTLFLDFNGDPYTHWRSDISYVFTVPETPPYSVDADLYQFSAVETAAIREIWSRVAEIYRPFNINVTTVDPGPLQETVSEKVVIGASSEDWFLPETGGTTGGVSTTGGFYRPDRDNWAYVFEDGYEKDGRTDVPKIAVAVAHEAGHAFGLSHQSEFNGSTLVQEYSDNVPSTTDATDPAYGYAPVAPTMGWAAFADRALWWNGKDKYKVVVNEPIALAKAEGLTDLEHSGYAGLGFRPDNAGNTSVNPLALESTATGWVIPAASRTDVGEGVDGVIEQIDDADWFSFTTTGGAVQFTAGVPAKLNVVQPLDPKGQQRPVGAMLDPKIELYDGSFSLIASADSPFPRNSRYSGDTIVRTLAEGTYYIRITGHSTNPLSIGGFADIGSYTLVGSRLADLTPTHPTGWSAEIVASTAGGTNTDAAVIHSDRPVYVDWAVLNQGAVATTAAQFHTKLYLDDTLIHTWYYAGPLASQGMQMEQDYQLGALSAGSHKIVVVTDAENEVTEADEANNTTTRWITVVPTPTNDAFADAIMLTGPVATATGRNTDATKTDTGEPNHAGNVGGASIWYSWTAPSSAAVTLETRGSSFDTLLGVYTTGTSGLVERISSDNVSSTDLTSRVTFSPAAGTTYYIAVDGKNTGAGAAAGFFVVHLKQAGASLPNLAATTPSGWSGSIVTSTVTGTRTSAASIHPGDYIYVDFAITNQGLASTTFQYFAKLLIDGKVQDSWYIVPPHNVGNARSISDAQVGPLPLGSYTFSVVVDYLDYIPESNESDNTFTRTVTVLEAPANDAFVNAQSLTGLSATATGTNAGATKQPGEPEHYNNTGGASVWYKWTAPAAGTVTLNTNGSDFDTVLAVYTGTSVSALTYVNANDEDPSRTDHTSALTFTATAGATYWIAVDGWNGSSGLPATGNVALHLTETPFKPNLKPFTPSNWDAPLVLSTVSGTSTNATTFHPGETIYVDWAVINAGQADTAATFHVELLVDDVHITDWAVSAPLQANWWNGRTDYQLAPLPLGQHTITLKTDYLFEVSETDGTDNDYSTTITVVAQPANDNLAGAHSLAGTSATATGTNVGATKEAGEPNHYSNAGGASVWYKWLAPATGTATLDTHGSSFDTILAVYTGSSVSALTAVGSGNDDDPNVSDHTSLYSFTATGGTSYWIAVEGYRNSSGVIATGSVTLHLVQSFPDLRPTPRNGAAYPLTISTVTGTNTNASVIHATDTVYVDWAALNAGQASTAATSRVDLLVDGQYFTHWTLPSSFAAGAAAALGISDYSIGKLTAGTHTIAIVMDYLNELTETDETNNVYTTTITVGVPVALSFASGNNQVYVRRNADTLWADVWVNSATPGQGTPTQQFLLSDTSRFSFAGGSATDQVTLDFSSGNPLPLTGFAIDGGGGSNTLVFIGSAGTDTLNAGAAALMFSDASGSCQIQEYNVQTVHFVGGSGGSDTLNVSASVPYRIDVSTPTGSPNVSVAVGSGAHVTFATAQRLAGLAVDGGWVTLAINGGTTFVKELSLTNGGRLDIANQDLLLDATATSLATVRLLLTAGYNGGAWNGAGGIGSSIVAANATAGWTLGYGEGARGIVAGLASDKLLVRCTLRGDRNLDRIVNFADLATVAQNYNTPSGATWAQGDFTGDGAVNFADLAIVAQNYNTTLPAPAPATLSAPAIAVETEAAPLPAAAAIPQIPGEPAPAMGRSSPPTAVSPAPAAASATPSSTAVAQITPAAQRPSTTRPARPGAIPFRRGGTLAPPNTPTPNPHASMRPGSAPINPPVPQPSSSAVVRPALDLFSTQPVRRLDELFTV